MSYFRRFAFEDYEKALPGHHLVVQCKSPRSLFDLQLSDSGPYAFITADNKGKLQQHFVLRRDILQFCQFEGENLGVPISDIILKEYPQRLALHMGTPAQVAETAGGVVYSFPLPKHVALNPGILEKARLGHPAEAGMTALTEQSYQWLRQKRLIDNTLHAEHFGGIVMDIIKRLPAMPLQDLFQNHGDFGGENVKKLQEYLNKNPTALAELEQKLIDARIDPKFQLAGTGKNGVFLKAGDVVVSIRGDLFNEHQRTLTLGEGKPLRRAIPQHLQSLAYFEHGPLNIEITPTLEVKNLPIAQLDNLVEEIAHTPHPIRGRQWHFNDPALRNVGFSHQETKYVLDGNAIGEASNVFGFHPKTKTPTQWLNADGTWKQYTEFQELHARFNSELHQAGGKLVDYEALEKIAAETKGKWAVGGAVLAGVAIIGAVAAAIHQKKSHTKAEEERRKAPAAGLQLN